MFQNLRIKFETSYLLLLFEPTIYSDIRCYNKDACCTPQKKCESGEGKCKVSQNQVLSIVLNWSITYFLCYALCIPSNFKIKVGASEDNKKSMRVKFKNFLTTAN